MDLALDMRDFFVDFNLWPDASASPRPVGTTVQLMEIFQSGIEFADWYRLFYKIVLIILTSLRKCRCYFGPHFKAFEMTACPARMCGAG